MISCKSIFYVTQYQDEAVQEVVEFMNTYSISQDDFDTIVELSKYQVTLGAGLVVAILLQNFTSFLIDKPFIRGIQIR